MAQGITLVNTQTTAAPSAPWTNSGGAYWLHGDSSSGTWTAAGTIQGCMTASIDADDWVDQASWSLSGTGSTDEDSAIAIVLSNASLPFGRLLISSISGTGAFVTVLR